AMGIPMGKYAGLSFGFMPISNTYYNAEDTAEVAGIGKTISIYNGQGSSQYAYMGLSGKYKGLSIGTNFGYMFGSSHQSSAFENYDTTNIANTEFVNYNTIGGLHWKAGALYQLILKKEQYIHIGATARIGQNLNVTRDRYAMSYRYGYDPQTQR